MAGYHPPPNYGGAYPPPVPAPIGFEMANYPEDVPNPGYPPRNDLYGPGYNYGHQQPHQPQPPSQSYDDYGNSTRAEDDRGLPPVGFEGIRHPKQDSDTATASGVHVSERSRPNTDNSRRTRTPEAEITTEYRVKEETVGSETLFFKRDKKKRIDYVLAFEINPDKDHDWQQKREEKRTEFERNLEKAGLELERVGEEESSNGKTSYIKIHAPWEVLTKGAEEMLMKMPISSNDMDTSDWTDRCFDCLGIRNPFELRNEDLKEEPNYFTCVFRRDRLNKFLVGDRETFFNPAQRSRIVYRILQKAKYGDNKVTQCGIKRLVANGSYTAAYPLHEGSHKMTQSLLTHQPENDRQVLKYCWASPRRWYKMQPLDHIR